MAGTLKRDLAKDYGLTLSWRFAEVEFLGLPKLKDFPVEAGGTGEMMAE